MDARHPTDTIVLHVAGLATVAGLAAGPPWMATVAAALAASIVLTFYRTPSPVLVGTPVLGERRSGLALEAPLFRMFHGKDGDAAPLRGGPASGNSGSDLETDESRGRDDEPTRDDETTYEDLAASLESDEDEEDISFLPPYASGDRPAGGSGEPLAIIWEPSPDSSLLNLLKDVLETSSKMPTHRRFALGTVAIIRNLLQPSEVEQILAEQRRYPRLRFGDIAVQLGLLSRAEIGELLEAQQEGVFTDEELIDTRLRLQAFQLESERRESA